MQKMLELVLEKHNKELELLKYRHKEELELQKANYENVINKGREALLLANRIRWDESGKYFSLKDFCRNTRDLLFLKEDGLKQYYASVGVLKKEKDKYIPNNEYAILVDNELFIEYSCLRKLIAVRSMIFFGEENVIDTMLQNFKENSDLITEQMGNTVYVECKQRSEEFKNHRENVNHIENREVK